MSTKLTAYQWVTLHNAEVKIIEGDDPNDAHRLEFLEKRYGVYDPKVKGVSL